MFKPDVYIALSLLRTGNVVVSKVSSNILDYHELPLIRAAENERNQLDVSAQRKSQSQDVLEPSSSPARNRDIPKEGAHDDTSLKYARRPRHKTKDDRYEYKAHEHAKKAVKIAGCNKRSARRKSGATLTDEYSAPNVQSERLTLKQNSAPGFLSKGRASIPVPFRGLPDLTFSEMSFLKHRRAADDTRMKAQQQEKETKRKSKNSKNGLSQYFARPTSHTSDRSVLNYDYVHRGSRSELSRPPPPTILYNQEHYRRIPEHFKHPIHGLGLNRVRRQRKQSADRLSRGAPASNETADVNIVSERATSYVSWSPSVKSRRQPYIAKIEKLTRQPNDLIRDAHGPELKAGTVHPRSSVSNVEDSAFANVLMERYLKSMARPKSRLRTANRQYYDLEDLKMLASLLPGDPDAGVEVSSPRRPLPPSRGPSISRYKASEARPGLAPAGQAEEDHYQYGRKLRPRSVGARFERLPTTWRQETPEIYQELEQATPGPMPMQHGFDVDPRPVDVSLQYYEGYFSQDTEAQSPGQREHYNNSRTDLQERDLNEFDLQLLRSPQIESYPTEQRPREYVDIRAIDPADSATQHQHRRPQLLRPLEEDSYDFEQFHGFSQPNLLL
jgi:hypothetical protein